MPEKTKAGRKEKTPKEEDTVMAVFIEGLQRQRELFGCEK